jgi:molybdopterin synthase catalytic subunit
MTWRYLTREMLTVDAWHGLPGDPRDGASVEFVGIVRADDAGRPVTWLEYEAYAPMADGMIARLIEQARQRWPLHQIHVRHRLGRVLAGEIAIVIGVRAAHRREAFEACQFLIDAIKADVPIWKREDGEHAMSQGNGCRHRAC